MPVVQPALAGIKVVSLEQAVAAPICSRRLAQAGAQVFKIERPEGDFARYYDTTVAGHSAYFVWLNAGKHSVVLDLRLAKDVALLIELIGASDVVMQNLKPGALASLGINFAELRAANPKLITLSISGFHPDGPSGQRKAYDLLMQAEAGLASITGGADAPGRVGVSVVDLSTGSFAYEAVLESLLRRAQTGQGEHIDVALFDSVAEWMAVPYLLQNHTGLAPQRVGLAHPGICPYGVFRSQDRQAFVLSIQNEREWLRLCEVALQQPQLARDTRCADNETRVQHRTFVDGAVQNVFEQLPYAQVKARLTAADIAFAPVNSVEQFANHPDLRTYTIEVGGQSVDLPQVPGLKHIDGAQSRVPELGEHTEAVRAWLAERS